MANVALTIALLPALFPGGGAGASDASRVVVAGAAPLDATETRLVAAMATTTTTSTTPPSTAAPAPKARTIPVTVRKPVPTTVVRRTVAAAPTPAPAKPVGAPPPAPAPTGNTQDGKATYYTGGGPGRCAHRTLPMGTVVTVTRVDNGATIHCTVADRGPFVAGYVIDLDPAEFEQLAPRSAGVVNVHLTW